MTWCGCTGCHPAPKVKRFEHIKQSDIHAAFALLAIGWFVVGLVVGYIIWG